MKNPAKVYDFIIVGSGMGGLVSSVLLSMKGYSVLVLEKNHQIGGSLQVFSRDKRIFDTGVHYVGSLDKGENLYQIFKFLGIMDDLKLKRLDDDCFDVVRFPDGSTYAHGQGYEQFSKILKKDFPSESEAIDLFCYKIQEICSFFPLYNLELDDPRVENYINSPEVLSTSAWEYVSSITKNKRLQATLLGSGLLYAGDRKTTPLYVVALIMNSYLKGSYRLEDGGSQIAKLLTKRLRAHGGEILKHQEVVNGIIEDGQVTAVETKNGERFCGKNFISNMHPKKTLEVFNEKNFRMAYRNRISKLKNTVSSFMLYLSFKKDSFPYINHNVYAYDTEQVWDTVSYDRSIWPEALFICTPATKNQGQYAESMSVMAYMDFAEVAQWSDSFNTVAKKGNRGTEYEKFKKETEERIIKKLEGIYPDIRNSIIGVYSSTPLTYKDYIGTEDGSLYGIVKDYNNILMSRIDARTRIPNLYLTGQNLVFHGVLGATIGAMVTCFNFLPKEKLISEIRDA